MSAPHSNHSDKNYPEDKVSHYPNKHKAVSDIHKGQMGTMLDLMAKHHKDRAIKGKMKEGIHRVGSNPSRFVHREPKGKFDLYEKFENGKQTFSRTSKKDH